MESQGEFWDTHFLLRRLRKWMSFFFFFFGKIRDERTDERGR